jgi:hypothetical protein
VAVPAICAADRAQRSSWHRIRKTLAWLPEGKSSLFTVQSSFFERLAAPRNHRIAVYLSGYCADTPGVIAAAVVAQAAALSGLRASLTAVLFSLGNGACAFRVSAFVLDCFGHRISPVRYLFTVLRCTGLKQGKTKRCLISEVSSCGSEGRLRLLTMPFDV